MCTIKTQAVFPINFVIISTIVPNDKRIHVILKKKTKNKSFSSLVAHGAGAYLPFL